MFWRENSNSEKIGKNFGLGPLRNFQSILSMNYDYYKTSCILNNLNFRAKIGTLKTWKNIDYWFTQHLFWKDRSVLGLSMKIGKLEAMKLEEKLTRNPSLS